MNDENWRALIVAILYKNEITPEEAFDILENGPREDIRGCVVLKQAGLSYREIGSFYGISRQAAFKRVQRQLNR